MFYNKKLFKTLMYFNENSVLILLLKFTFETMIYFDNSENKKLNWDHFKFPDDFPYRDSYRNLVNVVENFSFPFQISPILLLFISSMVIRLQEF